MKLQRIVVVMILFVQCLCCESVLAQKQFKALLVTTTRGWHHESVHAGVLAIQQLGIKEVAGERDSGEFQSGAGL